VVLPFANLGNDPGQQYFADGITEDLTTDLSRITHMLVISRESAFTYKDKSVNAKQIGRELGVRYVLEGSVQHSGNEVRINAQLIDAETDTHLWAERFDREVGDLFAVQDEITQQIAVALNAELINAEASRPNEHPDALDYILHGRAITNNGWTRENYARAIGFFEQALALDPRYIEAQGLLANTLTLRVLVGLTDTAAADTLRADKLIDQVLASSPDNALAHYVKGQVLRIQHRCPEAIVEFDKAISGDRNFAAAYGNLGWCKFVTGAIEEVIPLEERAIRLSPVSPFIGTLYFRIGLVRLLQSRTDEAIVWFKKALLPARPIQMMIGVHVALASAHALKGDTQQAASELATAREPGNPLHISLIKARIDREHPPPAMRALFDQTLLAGLRKAGLSEE
jgi:TolB-like protein/Tfp pilus assembly protein PilF